MSTLNLETGKPTDKPADPPKRRPGRPKGSTTKNRSDQSGAELAGRLDRTFDRLVEALEGRGDDELALIIREDKAAMRGGLVSLTRRFKPLRSPLLGLLALVEPVLAFGRVGRVLVGRVAAKRARIAQERADAVDVYRAPDDPMVPEPAYG